MHSKRIVTINAIGRDRPGIVSSVTTWLYKHSGNILETEAYQVKPHLFGIHVKTEIDESDKESIKQEIRNLCKELELKSKIIFENEKKIKTTYLLTTKETHCIDAILKHQADLSIKVLGIIGTDEIVRELAKGYCVPFDLVNIPERAKHDKAILQIIEGNNPDFIILPRYIRKITDIELLWLYRNLIINVHPSLLPAFPGANAYMQAEEANVHVHGATAHFINEKMDQGPIIWQEPYQRLPNESFDSFVERGREIEKKTLLNGVYYFANEAIVIRKDKVEFKKGNVLPKLLL